MNTTLLVIFYVVWIFVKAVWDTHAESVAIGQSARNREALRADRAGCRGGEGAGFVAGWMASEVIDSEDCGASG